MKDVIFRSPKKSFVIYAGEERYPVDKKIEVIGLPELMKILRKL